MCSTSVWWNTDGCQHGSCLCNLLKKYVKDAREPTNESAFLTTNLWGIVCELKAAQRGCVRQTSLISCSYIGFIVFRPILMTRRKKNEICINRAVEKVDHTKRCPSQMATSKSTASGEGVRTRSRLPEKFTS